MSQQDAYELALAKRYRQVVPGPFRALAYAISMAFHPLFMLSYAYILLAVFNPFLFGEATTARVFSMSRENPKGTWFVAFLLFSCIIPLVGVLLMRGLGMVHTLSLETRDERKIPYVLAGLFYMSLVVQNNHNSELPDAIKIITLGATIALFTAFFINLFSKISMHTVGAGGFLAMLMIIIAESYAPAHLLLIVGLLVCGLVGTARLLLGAHKLSDIYGGYFVGFIGQFIAITYYGLS
ncbi:MAG: phosphatase PAP2 family protein [Aureispira sp.]